MANLSYIDTEKSITSGRLYFSCSKLERVEQMGDTIVWCILCIAIIFYPTLAYVHFDINSSNDKAVGFVLFPLIIFFGLYGLYRKLTEKKLFGIDTSSPRYKNKEYLFEFLKLKGYSVFKESKDILIVNIEESLSFNNLWAKSITFIIDDRRIYFTMVKNYPKINPPVFFSHLSLKADLKKYFKDK